MARLQTASIAKRMSWAASRTTTRPEDLAYCLLGIFDITFPLVYGEGQKAFKRLQEEIIKLYPHDHSIYAWGSIVELDAQSTEIQLRPPDQLNKPLLGLLARSPKDFINSGGVSPVPWTGRFYRMPGKGKPTPTPAVIVGKGIKVDLPVRLWKFQSEYVWGNISELQVRPGIYAMLLCTTPNFKSSLITLPLVSWGDSYFGRTETSTMAHNVKIFPYSLIDAQQTLHVAAEIKIQPRADDMVIRGLAVVQLRNLRFAGWTTGTAFDFEQDKIVRVGRQHEGQFIACDFIYHIPMATGFSIVLGRTKAHEMPSSVCYMEVIPSRPPFPTSYWDREDRERHRCYFTNPNYLRTTIPHQLEGISIFGAVKRVLVTRPHPQDICNFIDIVDLQVSELDTANTRNVADIGYLAGTIPLILELPLHRLDELVR